MRANTGSQRVAPSERSEQGVTSDEERRGARARARARSARVLELVKQIVG
jgi:hypothetical protein